MLRAPASVLFQAFAFVASILLLTAPARAEKIFEGEPSGSGTYEEFVALVDEFMDWRTPQVADAALDYGPAAIRGRKREMRDYQKKLADMNVVAWTKEQKVDYLVARAYFDEQDFIYNVTTPWTRDPHFYSAGLFQTAFTELPAEGETLETLKAELAAAPKVLSAAKKNLTNVAGDLADFALFNMQNSDGVNHMHPYRETPPDGTIGWYEDLLARAKEEQPDLVPEVEAALAALKDYRDWLKENRESFTAPNGVGEKYLDWYLKHVKMLPYTSKEVEVLAEMEKDRLLAFLALEEHRNRDLPKIELPTTREEYQKRLAETDKMIRDFIEEEEFISVPDYIPSDWRELGYNVPFIKRKIPPNFWEQVQFRDPTPDHLHAVIPGHRYDGLVEKKLNHPIRRESFGDRREGYAVYLEEAALQAGLLDDKPRTRELIYVFGLWRAVRTIGDVRNQTNEYTQPETMEYWLEWTPYLDEGVARKYSYLRPTPAHTLHYTMGALQMRKLLADRKHQLGDKFVLKEFHDSLMERGRIPMALIRYEMTGYTDDIAPIWDRTPLSEVR